VNIGLVRRSHHMKRRNSRAFLLGFAAKTRRVALRAAAKAFVSLLGWMRGFIQLRLPSATRIAAGSGPFAVRILFAFVGSPCTSPILIAVLNAAAKSGSPL